MKIVFMGTPEFASHALEQIIAQDDCDVVACYCSSDKPKGRGHKVQSPPVAMVARKHNIDLYQPTTLRTEQALEEFRNIDADVVIVAAYGFIIPEAMLKIPKYGFINIHGSVLPRWRGAAPIHRAIEAGDKTTGITIMHMDAGLDTGDMIMWDEIPINDDDDTGTMTQKLMVMGGRLIVETLKQLNNNKTLPRIAQDNDCATYAHKITKKEAVIEGFHRVSKWKVFNKVRAFSPWPLCELTISFHDVKVVQVRVDPNGPDDNRNVETTVVHHSNKTVELLCKDGNVFVEKVKVPNKGIMSTKDFINGYL